MMVHCGCTVLLISVIDTIPGVTPPSVLRGIFETISGAAPVCIPTPGMAYNLDKSFVGTVGELSLGKESVKYKPGLTLRGNGGRLL